MLSEKEVRAMHTVKQPGGWLIDVDGDLLRDTCLALFAVRQQVGGLWTWLKEGSTEEENIDAEALMATCLTLYGKLDAAEARYTKLKEVAGLSGQKRPISDDEIMARLDALTQRVEELEEWVKRKEAASAD